MLGSQLCFRKSVTNVDTMDFGFRLDILAAICNTVSPSLKTNTIDKNVFQYFLFIKKIKHFQTYTLFRYVDKQLAHFPTIIEHCLHIKLKLTSQSVFY